MRITYSATLTIRKDRPGNAALYLLLRVGQEKCKVGLNINVDPKQWDDVRKRVKGKGEEAQKINSQLESEVGRAASILNTYRLKESATGERGLLTMERFKLELTGQADYHNFITFALAEIERRKPGLAYNTYRGHKSRIKKLEKFRAVIPFNELTPKLLLDYSTWLSKRGNKIGARETALKTVRAYVKLALLSGHEFKDPFGTFRIKKGSTHREFLEMHELKKLINHYKDATTKPHHRHTLDLFLFQCFAGVRYGDLDALHYDMIINDSLRLMPEKTRDKQKTIELPLSSLALRHIQGRRGKLFKKLANQSANDNLKEIAKLLGINKRLTTHVGRHTFATLFLELGGSIDVLQHYLGHGDLKTTMIYMHMSDGRPREQIKLFDKLL